MRPTPIPVTLADGTRCASIDAAAKALGCSRPRVRRLLDAGLPLTPRVNLAELCRRHDTNPARVRERMNRGWSLESALTIEKQPSGPRPKAHSKRSRRDQRRVMSVCARLIEQCEGVRARVAA